MGDSFISRHGLADFSHDDLDVIRRACMSNLIYTLPSAPDYNLALWAKIIKEDNPYLAYDMLVDYSGIVFKYKDAYNERLVVRESTLPAYCAYYYSDDWFKPVFLSKYPDGVTYKMYNTVFTYQGTINIDGVTWYWNAQGSGSIQNAEDLSGYKRYCLGDRYSEDVAGEEDAAHDLANIVGRYIETVILEGYIEDHLLYKSLMGDAESPTAFFSNQNGRNLWNNNLSAESYMTIDTDNFKMFKVGSELRSVQFPSSEWKTDQMTISVLAKCARTTVASSPRGFRIGYAKGVSNVNQLDVYGGYICNTANPFYTKIGLINTYRGGGWSFYSTQFNINDFKLKEWNLYTFVIDFQASYLKLFINGKYIGQPDHFYVDWTKWHNCYEFFVLSDDNERSGDSTVYYRDWMCYDKCLTEEEIKHNWKYAWQKYNLRKIHLWED